jgi:hypothetical protein
VTSGTNSVYVFSIEAVKRAVPALVGIRTHEHFAGYLAILRAIRASGSPKVSPTAIYDFHDRYLQVEGNPQFPYVSPFRSRGAAALKRINKNLAGSYAPSSLRADRPIVALITIEGQGNAATYTLRPDHVSIASKLLLRGNKIPAVALSAYLYRDYGFALEQKEISRVLGVFRDQFGLRAAHSTEAAAFNMLFTDDTSNFSNNDLVLPQS